MYFSREQARRQTVSATDLIRRAFGAAIGVEKLDAEFLSARRDRALGFAGLPYAAPICGHLLGNRKIDHFLENKRGNILFRAEEGRFRFFTEQGEQLLPVEIADAVSRIYWRILTSCGQINEKGELLLDLKSYPIGPHYPVNLLLGDRTGYPYPLCTTPKSALDAFGRGSFRAAGSQQVLATRCVLQPEENGEPANRQFYLVEDGKQIFYSADAHNNVAKAVCRHSQNRTSITYQTECGLEVHRTIFILPQREGMPSAVEAQRVEIVNRSNRPRRMKIVMTGVFGISEPETTANDVVFANIVVESEVVYHGEKPVALTLHAKPKNERGRKRFALLLCGGETLDEFCVNQSEFIGRGTLEKPELVGHLPSRYQRKMAPFFAIGKAFSVQPGETAIIDEFIGMTQGEECSEEIFEKELSTLIETYRNPNMLQAVYQEIVDFWDRYPSYIRPKSDDSNFNGYIGHNLPFQVLYQTYVSRAFAWTQKSYRETGFREIQDIYASMYYLDAIGKRDLVKDLIAAWASNVFRMGYAYHDFTFQGKEPGDCSDDSLWLVQAVYRYVKLTGDTGFLSSQYPIAGECGTRPLWDTLMSILTYSGRISVGKHGLPLLDKADWNDTLKLDKVVFKGPEKERLYRRQLQEKGQSYGAPWENELSESVMNACLLKIAADQIADMARMTDRPADAGQADEISAGIYGSVQANGWKDDFFARCLINDGRPYTYLGAKGDGLALEPQMNGSYFLNSYSWPILAGIATEDQIRSMLGIVEKHLKTNAGLKLCTLVNFDRLDVDTGTALYFPGDRENGGVFKHAAMMAAVASLKAAKWVKEEALARQLADLAFFMIGKTLPYNTLKDPFTLKGNPRFCTQYNNSQTCENIGPMLSGTASWLNLAIFEIFGVDVRKNHILFCPILKSGMERMDYTLRLEDAVIEVSVQGAAGSFRPGIKTVYTLDGQTVDARVPRPGDGACHTLRIEL